MSTYKIYERFVPVEEIGKAIDELSRQGWDIVSIYPVAMAGYVQIPSLHFGNTDDLRASPIGHSTSKTEFNVTHVKILAKRG